MRRSLGSFRMSVILSLLWKELAELLVRWRYASMSAVLISYRSLGELELIAKGSYRVTLNILEKNPENETLLSKCHKRCAERWV